MPRPCPFVGCRYNLYLDATIKGNLKLNFPDLEPGDMPVHGSCVLDVVDAGGATLEEAGGYLNITRERVRQIEHVALAKLRAAGVDL